MASSRGNAVRRSPTALKGFLECERRWYYQRILKLPEPPSIHLCIGSLYHAAIERMARQGQFTPDCAQALIATSRSEDDWVDPGVTDDELSKELVGAMGRVSAVLGKLPPVRDAEGPFVERWGRRYTCKLDYLSTHTPVVEGGEVVGAEPGLCVIDHKVVFSRRRRSQGDTDNSPQLALYAVETGANHAAYLEIPRDGAPINVIVAEFQDDELRRWASYLDAQFKAMNSRGEDESQYRLAERGHPLCSPRWCPYWSRCVGGGAA